MKIYFLFGAGAEGNRQYDIVTGNDIKKEMIICKDYNTLFKSINRYDYTNLVNWEAMFIPQSPGISPRKYIHNVLYKAGINNVIEEPTTSAN